MVYIRSRSWKKILLYLILKSYLYNEFSRLETGQSRSYQELLIIKRKHFDISKQGKVELQRFRNSGPRETVWNVRNF